MKNYLFFSKFIIVFAFILSAIQLYAQKRVERLKTDKDVVKFVKDFFSDMEYPDKTWKSFELVNGNEWKGVYNISDKLDDSLSKLPLKKWQVADFNFDKKKDLVVCGKRIEDGHSYFSVLVFLSHYDDYQVESIVPNEFQLLPSYFSLLVLPNTKAIGIRLVQWFPDRNKNGISQYLPYTIDTLGFAKQFFVNFNPKPDTSILKNITYESLDFDGKRMVVKILDLDKDSISPFVVIKYDKSGDSTTLVNGKIKSNIYNILLSLINYSGFENLQDYFQENGNSPGTHIVDVNYVNGTHKKIEDLSIGGTYTLSAIYKWYDWVLNYVQEISKKENL